MCGEQMCDCVAQAWVLGSPPRVRGTAPCNNHTSGRIRITPACAGNRAPPPAAGPRGEDHPRVCGEQAGAEGAEERFGGSPPRVRGTEHRRIQAGGIGRITPACAGNRHNDITSQALNWDHPRVCGEQIFLPQIFESLSGSLPRVRGTAGIRFMGESCVRITPACAGNSFPGPVWCKWVKDHPRVCGEQISGAKAAMRVMGSPPRVRGTDWQAFIRSVRRGITPACAGNRIRSRFSRRCLWDHPRVCGEQYQTYSICSPNSGSPPRVRGTVGNPG